MDNPSLEAKFLMMLPRLDERQTRLYLALESMALGVGGAEKVSIISGVGRATIFRGLEEIKTGAFLDDDMKGRCRAKGGGRHSLTTKYPTLEDEVKRILDQNTAGDPMSTVKRGAVSLRSIQRTLALKNISASPTTIGKIIHDMDYSLQANKKALALKPSEPDRDEQMAYINSCIDYYVNNGEPIVSIDCKKKENLGNFANKGSVYRPEGEPTETLDHDFPIEPSKEMVNGYGCGRAVPYGIYDIAKNKGFVNVGLSGDTPKFAVESIRRWWWRVGAYNYPDCEFLTCLADSGGSNDSRFRSWRWEIYRLSVELGFPILILHYPPGTSKHNKIEHKMFSFISLNWRGIPLQCIDIVVDLINGTTTLPGLTIICVKDDNEYLTGQFPTEEEMSRIASIPAFKHGNRFYLNLPIEPILVIDIGKEAKAPRKQNTVKTIKTVKTTKKTVTKEKTVTTIKTTKTTKTAKITKTTKTVKTSSTEKIDKTEIKS
jgi:hypothetical protein